MATTDDPDAELADAIERAELQHLDDLIAALEPDADEDERRRIAVRLRKRQVRGKTDLPAPVFQAPDRGAYWTRAQVEKLVADGYQITDRRRKNPSD